MRPAFVSLVLLAGVFGTAVGQSKLNTRYNIDYDSISYPQSTPKEGLTSLVKAIKDRRVDYMLAHLSDPAFVDQRVQDVHGGKFEELVKEVTGKLTNDPESIKLLERFAAEGKWETSDTNASAKLKDVRDQVYLRQLNFRWFLENRKSAEKGKDDKKDEKKEEKKEEK